MKIKIKDIETIGLNTSGNCVEIDINSNELSKKYIFVFDSSVNTKTEMKKEIKKQIKKQIQDEQQKLDLRNLMANEEIDIDAE